MYSLSIYLDSFNFTDDLVQEDNKIRINIITIPDENKQSILINSKDMKNVNKCIKINITDKIREILFVFKKTNYLEKDQIIASTIVHVSQLPQSYNDKKNKELQTINIYEPIHYIQPENITIYGHMIAKFSIKKQDYHSDQNKENLTQYFVNNENNHYNNGKCIIDRFDI